MSPEKEPTPVSIVSPAPVPVEIVTSPSPSPATVIKGEGVTLSPTTTEQEDVVTQGQREINKIWENTQSWIALYVVVSGILVNGFIVGVILLLSLEVTVNQLALITISLQFINLTTGIVIGFYFSRTNHSAKGGVGAKTDSPYTGR